MKRLIATFLESNKLFYVALGVICMIMIVVVVAFHSILLPKVSKLYESPYETSNIEGALWTIMALSDNLNEIFIPHADALTGIQTDLKSDESIRSVLKMLNDLPGVKRSYCLKKGSNLLSYPETNRFPDLADSLREMRGIFEKYAIGVIGHPKKFHNWMVNKIRLINTYTGTDTLRLMICAYDSVGTYFRVVAKEKFNPSLIMYLFALELDERWLREAIPTHMERVFYDCEIFALWSPANPKTSFSHGAGVIGLGDTLWWVGLRSINANSDFEGVVKDWPWPGRPWYSFRTITQETDEVIQKTQHKITKHKSILLFADISSVLITIILIVGLIQVRKQWIARQIALAHLAHSIKTPVARIRLDTDSLIEEMVASPAEESEIITAIGRECGRMERAVQSAALSMEEGKRTFNLESCDLAQIVSDTTLAWQIQFDQAGIKLMLDKGDVPLSGHFDREMIAVMIDNLLDNALRHTMLNLDNIRKGEAGVTVQLQKVDGTGKIIVDDMGGGIPAADRKHIFKRFRRAKGDAASGVSGLGLGLSLVKEIVEANGGKVHVTDNDSGGARFVVELPVEV